MGKDIDRDGEDGSGDSMEHLDRQFRARLLKRDVSRGEALAMWGCDLILSGGVWGSVPVVPHD